MADPLRNACVTGVREELERYGLRSTAEVVNNGHVEVSWEWKGQRRFSRMSATPSDCFAHLKALADVRRILRRDEVPLPVAKVTTLAYALSPPKPVAPQVDRLKHLEGEFMNLLDMVGDVHAEFDTLKALAEQVQAENADLKAKLAGLRVTVSFGDTSVPVPIKPEVKVTRVYEKPEGPSARILEHMPVGRWVPISEIYTTLKIDQKLVSSTLQYLKKVKGLVENGQRGLWRKKAEALVLVENG